jgi:hypothetical protein
MADTTTLDGELINDVQPWRSAWPKLAIIGLLIALLALMAWGLRAQAGGPVESGLAPDFSTARGHLDRST